MITLPVALVLLASITAMLLDAEALHPFASVTVRLYVVFVTGLTVADEVKEPLDQL